MRSLEPPQFMLNPPPYPGAEIASFLIIAIVSFIIYFKTKEIYDLTKHKGVDYFRKAFLFFGISSLLSAINFGLRFIFDIPFLHIRGGFFGMSFFSLIAILYAFYSLFSKELKHEFLIYVIAFLLISFGFLIHQREIVFLFQAILLITIGVISYIKYRHKKKKSISNMYLIYILLFIFWFINAIRFQLLIFFDVTGEVISIISALIFVYILYIFLQRFMKN